MKKDLKERYENGILIVPANAICCYACANYTNDYCEKLGEIKSAVSSKCDLYLNIMDLNKVRA